jgi:RNA polymerase sigma-70 factor (ECF subfamily)
MDWIPSNTGETELCAVFDRCQGELLGTLFYWVGNVEDARDTLQDTFVKCWQHRAELPGITNIRAWVFRIALNTARDRRASAWSRRREPLAGVTTMLSPPDHAPDTALLRDEEVGLIREAILSLEPGEQEIFLLRQNGDLTYEDIAEMTGHPVGTVKTRMRSALKKLRDAVQAN